MVARETSNLEAVGSSPTWSGGCFPFAIIFELGGLFLMPVEFEFFLFSDLKRARQTSP